MARYFIERTPNSTGTIYEVYSEEHASILKVTRESSVAGCQLNYCGAKDFLTAYVPLNSLEFKLQDSFGAAQGYVREAGFSIMGKSIVEDENHNVIGVVKSGFRPKMKVFSSDGKTLAEVRRNCDKKAPFFLRPSKVHLFRRYVVQTASDALPDNRLVFTVVCLLVAEEWQSSAS